jgi:hypothetical protein
VMAPVELYTGMLAMGFAGSALVGFLRTDDCRESKRMQALFAQQVTAL